jgi:hypothetical protein
VTITDGCWVAFNVPGCGPCDGPLVRAHLIKQQTIRREAGKQHVWDDRVWVPCCGGPTGVGGHHGQLDYARSLRIPRSALPVMVEEFAAEHGLTWWLEREYGATELAA